MSVKFNKWFQLLVLNILLVLNVEPFVLYAPLSVVIMFFLFGQSGVGFILVIILPSRYITHLISHDDKYFKTVKEIEEMIEDVKKS